MATYTAEQERRAQDRLAEIWRASTRREKLRIAERFGYRGTDESKLRVMRRMLTSSLGPGEKANVSDYFKPYSTSPQEDVWKGRVPPWELDSPYLIKGYVMYVTETDGTLTSWEQWLNLDGEKLGRGEGEVKSRSIKRLFEDFNWMVRHVLSRYQSAEGFNPEARPVAGIAFTNKGAKALIDELEKKWDQPIGIPVHTEPFGINIHSTTHDYEGDERQPLRSKTYQRAFPKGKRHAMIAYANRAYGQMTRTGGRLA